jgi:hypothetical protein
LRNIEGKPAIKCKLNEEDVIEPRPINEDFICKICSLVVNDPVQCRQCSCLLCRECKEGWHMKQGDARTCAFCRAVDAEKEIDKIIKNTLASFKFKCPAEGCG